MDREEIVELVNTCSNYAREGTPYHPEPVILPHFVLDFRPPRGYLKDNNPAIFVNERTFRLTANNRREEKAEAENPDEYVDWVVNQTLVISENVLEEGSPKEKLLYTGVIIHETGHGYNVAAGIPNTEANAYLFEIMVLKHLFDVQHEVVQGLTRENLVDYFKMRMPQYKMGFSNVTLRGTVGDLANDFDLNDLLTVPKVEPNPFQTARQVLFPNPEVKPLEPAPKEENIDIARPGTIPPIK